MVKKIYFTNSKGIKKTIKVGDIVICYTNIPTDIYKITDGQVILGQKKKGDRKPRYTLVTEILDNNHFIGISVTHAQNKTKNKIIAARNSNLDDYQFSFSMMKIYNVKSPKDFIDRCHKNDQLKDKQGILKFVFQNPIYFEKSQKIKNKNFFKNPNTFSTTTTS